MVMTQRQVILRLMESLANTEKTGDAAWDEAVRQFGYSSFRAVRQRFWNDYKPYDNYSSASVRTFLENYCSIRPNTADIGAIIGSDAGGAVAKTMESIVQETTAAKQLTASQYNRFKCNGLTVNIYYATADYGFSLDQETLKKKEKLVVKNLYNWWIRDSLDVINKSLGLNFSDGRASVTELEVKFTAANDSSYMPIELRYSTDSDRAAKLTLTIDMNYFTALKDSDRNGTIKKYGTVGYADRMILQSLTEAALAANINGFSKLDNYFRHGLVALVVGGDKECGFKNRIECSTQHGPTGFWNDTLEAYAVLRYLARQVSDASLPRGITASRDLQTLTVTSSFRGSFAASSYSETVKNIDARKSNRSITLKGNTKGNTIRAGFGGGNYYGMGGNDILYGGKGKDIFWYAKGDGIDTIYDFTTDKDVIRLTSKAALAKAVLSGSDALLKMGNGSIIIKKGIGKTITVMDDTKRKKFLIVLPKGVTINSNRTALTVKDPFSGTLDIASYTPSILNIDASKNENDLIIKGNNNNNIIKAGMFGGDYYGRKGNDILYGGDGEDFFWYGAGDGNDVIRNFRSDEDVICYYRGGLTGYSSSGTDVILKTGTGSMRVAGMTNKRMDIQNEKGAVAVHLFGRQDKENSFYYDKSYYYHGSVNKKDTIKIASGETVSLANTARFQNIDVLDAGNSYASVKLTGGAKSSTLIGSKKNDTLTAGAGGGKLQGNKGNDTLVAGKSRDVFWYGTGDGNDTIRNFQSGKDVLRYYKGTFSSSFVTKGSDLTLKTGTGSVKLVGMANKRVDIANAQGKTSIHWFGRQDKKNTFTYSKNHHYHGSAKLLDTVLLKTGASLSLGNSTQFQSIDVLDASSSNAAVQLVGGSRSSKLIGSRKNDVLKAGITGTTLDGGKGNDMLYGGKGKDAFIFQKGYGRDTIVNSGKGDIAYLYNISNIQQLCGTSSKGVLSLKFTNSADALTIKNWSADGLNTIVINGGAKYRLGVSSGRVTTNKI